jgi:hypothetical protein
VTQPEPTPLEPVAAPYVGFRHWHVVGDRLCSVGRHPLVGVRCPSGSGPTGRVEWPIRQLAALPCADGPAPAFDCSCGIYATHKLHDPGSAWRSGPQYARHVVGAVALWGRVVEHEWGYRAQYARPVSLLEGFGVETVADAYGIPVLSAEELLDHVGDSRVDH